MKIYLLRHGETAWNAQGRYLGRTDLPLTPSGREALGRADFAPARVYVSPLCRTAETAEILFPGAEQAVVPDFREMDFGVFEGRTWREMEHDGDYRAWVESGCTGRCPGGESREEFSARVCGAFAGLVDGALAGRAERLVIVAHGGTQMAVMERFALPRRDYFSWRGPLGGGFVLDGSRWREERLLTLLDTVRYRRGERE